METTFEKHVNLMNQASLFPNCLNNLICEYAKRNGQDLLEMNPYNDADNFSWDLECTNGYVYSRGTRIKFKSPAAFFYSKYAHYDNYLRCGNLLNLIDYLKTGYERNVWMKKVSIYEARRYFIIQDNLYDNTVECHMDCGSSEVEFVLMINTEYLQSIIEELEDVFIYGEIENIDWCGV